MRGTSLSCILLCSYSRPIRNNTYWTSRENSLDCYPVYKEIYESCVIAYLNIGVGIFVHKIKMCCFAMNV